jgi:hypothetical protein
VTRQLQNTSGPDPINFLQPSSFACNMGSVFSITNTPTENEPHTNQIMDTLPTQEPDHRPYYGFPVPTEASMTRDDSQTWYAVFFEQAECVPHRDGKQVIIRWPNLPRGHIHDYGRELTGWPVVKIQNVYQRLGENHPRIVQ